MPRKIEEAGADGAAADLENQTTWSPLSNASPESTQGPINWQGDDRIILHDQAAVAAHIDESGELVIEQRDTLGMPEAMIFIAPESVKLFAQAISRLAGEIVEPTNSSAERARRYREKRKRDVTVTRDAGVTQRDAERDASQDQRDASVTQLRVVRPST